MENTAPWNVSSPKYLVVHSIRSSRARRQHVGCLLRFRDIVRFDPDILSLHIEKTVHGYPARTHQRASPHGRDATRIQIDVDSDSPIWSHRPYTSVVVDVDARRFLVAFSIFRKDLVPVAMTCPRFFGAYVDANGWCNSAARGDG